MDISPTYQLATIIVTVVYEYMGHKMQVILDNFIWDLNHTNHGRKSSENQNKEQWNCHHHQNGISCISSQVTLMHSNQLRYVNKQLTILNIMRMGEDLHTVELSSGYVLHSPDKLGTAYHQTGYLSQHPTTRTV